MKQYTDKDQTAKLIELGFPKPKTYHDLLWDENDKLNLIGWQINYSIGELIEFLQPRLVRIEQDKQWIIDTIGCLSYDEVLIDALFDACVKLKEEGVI